MDPSDARARLWLPPPAIAVKPVPLGVSVTGLKLSSPQLTMDPSDARARLWWNPHAIAVKAVPLGVSVTW